MPISLSLTLMKNARLIKTDSDFFIISQFPSKEPFELKQYIKDVLKTLPGTTPEQIDHCRIIIPEDAQERCTDGNSIVIQVLGITTDLTDLKQVRFLKHLIARSFQTYSLGFFSQQPHILIFGLAPDEEAQCVITDEQAVSSLLNPIADTLEKHRLSDEVPLELTCPITGQIFWKPCRIHGRDNAHYESDALHIWVSKALARGQLPREPSTGRLFKTNRLCQDHEKQLASLTWALAALKRKQLTDPHNPSLQEDISDLTRLAEYPEYASIIDSNRIEGKKLFSRASLLTGASLPYSKENLGRVFVQLVKTLVAEWYYAGAEGDAAPTPRSLAPNPAGIETTSRPIDAYKAWFQKNNIAIAESTKAMLYRDFFIWIEVIRFDINVVDDAGKTALHTAIEHFIEDDVNSVLKNDLGFFGFIDALITTGTNMHIRDIHGVSTHDLLTQHPNAHDLWAAFKSLDSADAIFLDTSLERLHSLILPLFSAVQDQRRAINLDWAILQNLLILETIRAAMAELPNVDSTQALTLSQALADLQQGVRSGLIQEREKGLLTVDTSSRCLFKLTQALRNALNNRDSDLYRASDIATPPALLRTHASFFTNGGEETDTLRQAFTREIEGIHRSHRSMALAH